MFPDLSCLLLILRQNGFFRNLGNNKQPQLESALAWIWSMNLWTWSRLVCLHLENPFKGVCLDYVPCDVFASCKVWFEVVGTRLWTNPWESQSWKEPKKVLFLSPCIQGEEFANHSRQTVADPVFVTHPRVGVLIVPKGLFEKKAPNIPVLPSNLKLIQCEQWWERYPVCFLGGWWCEGVYLWRFKIWKICSCSYHSDI